MFSPQYFLFYFNGSTNYPDKTTESYLYPPNLSPISYWLLNPIYYISSISFFFYFYFFYFTIVTERERQRGRDIGRGRSRLHALGAQSGIRSRVSRIAPWAKGRLQTAAPPRDPSLCLCLCLSLSLSLCDYRKIKKNKK